MEAVEGPDQEVCFDEDEISLDIPLEGCTVQNGWTITPLAYPGVSIMQTPADGKCK